MDSPPPESQTQRLIRDGLIPAAVYLLGFAVLTFPLIFRIHTHHFAAAGDGLQNLWNLWWIEKAVTELRVSPWRTTWLHHPGGVTLLAHTLNPFNGLLAIPLIRLFGLIPAYNAIVVFSFVAGGVTAYWLALHVTASRPAALVAGWLFTFSSFHFAHAAGHLQLVALEWIPLFILCWLRLMEAPSARRGLAAAFALFLVILCDYYYFFYCVMTGALVVAWRAARSRDAAFFLRRGHRTALATFVGAAALTSGALAVALLVQQSREPFLGAHDPVQFSTDLLAPFIPGGHWRFAALTRGYWSAVTGNIHESSVYLGWGALGLAAFAWVRRRRTPSDSLGLWLILAIAFYMLSLGPSLHIAERSWNLWTPYDLLVRLLPPLRISGMPVRMMVMTTLAVAMLAAIGFKALLDLKPGRRVIPLALGALIFIETLPRPPAALELEVPDYVTFLRDLPGGGGATLDLSSDVFYALYFQTIHEKPLAGGYLARYPESVFRRWERLKADARAGRWERLASEESVRFIIAPPGEFPPDRFGDPIYRGPFGEIFDLNRTPAPPPPK